MTTADMSDNKSSDNSVHTDINISGCEGDDEFVELFTVFFDGEKTYAFNFRQLGAVHKTDVI